MSIGESIVGLLWFVHAYVAQSLSQNLFTDKARLSIDMCPISHTWVQVYIRTWLWVKNLAP